jgi:hypothetical protein
MFADVSEYYPEDSGKKFLRNWGKHLSNYMAIEPRTTTKEQRHAVK